MIHFEHPAVLLLLVPLALVAWWLARRGRPAAIAWSSADLVRAVGKTRQTRWGRFLPALRWLGAALLVVALARPQVHRHRAEVQASGVDVMLALDLSGSMEARDMRGEAEADSRTADVSSASAKTADRAPKTAMESRLSAAKDVIARFVADRPSDRIGLVGFAGESWLASPLTLDHDWVQQAVERLDPRQFRDGTAIGSAIATAVRRLDAQDAKSKILVLATDGQNNAGKITPRAAAEAAKALGIKIYTVGVGSKGEALVPVTDERGRRELVTSNVDVDEPTLRDVAESTGGRYYRATDSDALRRVYEEIDRLEKTTRTMHNFTERTERFAWFAIPGLLLTVASFVLSATRFRRVP